MSIRIIADSCCDLTPSMKETFNILTAPLTVNIIGGREYVDDETADIPQLIADLAVCEHGAKSTCPSPEAYAALMRQCEACFVITLSSKLSGSHNAACVARDMVLEETPEKKIHIVDSLAAVVAETQIAYFLHQKINAGLSFEEIIPLVEDFKHQQRTYFILEDLGNLFKNGRLMKVAGRIATMVRLCPLMGDDGEGNIRLVYPSLGIERSLRKLVELIAHWTEDKKEKSILLMIGFCNCLERAEKLRQRLMSKCPALSEIILVPTGVLSTMYANNGGVVVAFQQPAGK